MRKTSLNCVHQLAKADDRVIFIGSDLGVGVLDAMKKELPERWFMEGIAEQHIIGMAAGLAIDGFIPFVNTIATFLTRRCYEQLAIDVCLHRLPVRLIGNGGGVVYAPLGPTHQATDDLALMRALPNMTIIAPCDAEEMKRVMNQTITWPDPIYIRLGKGGEEIVSKEENGFSVGRGIVMREAGEVLFIVTGVMLQTALAVAGRMSEKGVNVGVLHLPTVKPLDKESIERESKNSDAIFVIEEHSIIGGLGSAVAEVLMEAGIGPKCFRRIGIPDRFPEGYGNQASLLEKYELGIEHIEAAAITALNRP
jgi:transketolase